MYRILFVDDHVDILEANRSYFAEAGFAATACSSGAQALETLACGEFDCIVLDVMMPDMDGYALCRTVRQKHDTPLIFLSCLDQPDDRVLGLMAGGDVYMTKPYDLRELHAQVLACLRRASRPAAPEGDFAVDVKRRIVRLYEHSAILSRKEMALLELFMNRPDEILSKETLCTALWPGEAVDGNRLQVLVRSLRRKVDFAATPLGRIENVYGQGYRLAREVAP